MSSDDREYNVFRISGYWKDDKEEFKEYVVVDAEAEDVEDLVTDDEVFYYGITREEIEECIRAGSTPDDMDFVITSYEEVI